MAAASSLDRFLDPVDGCLTPDVARRIGLGDLAERRSVPLPDRGRPSLVVEIEHIDDQAKLELARERVAPLDARVQLAARR